MPCDEWSTLLKRYQLAVLAYHETVNRFNAEFGEDFTSAWQHAESARRKSCDCRNALMAHERRHACVEEQPKRPKYFVAAAAYGGTEDMVLGDQGQGGG